MSVTLRFGLYKASGVRRSLTKLTAFVIVDDLLDEAAYGGKDTRIPTHVFSQCQPYKEPIMSEPFEYSPLPGPTCTRLVSLVAEDDASRLPSQGEPLLQLSLCTVDLQDAPHYEALSYTWGSPFPQMDVRS